MQKAHAWQTALQERALKKKLKEEKAQANDSGSQGSS